MTEERLAEFPVEAASASPVIVGRSPLAIGLARLRHDKVAMVCLGIVGAAERLRPAAPVRGGDYGAAEAGLSFLGIGVHGRPSWGQTIDAATQYWQSYPLYLWEPVAGILLPVVALNLLGDAVRDAFDPTTRR